MTGLDLGGEGGTSYQFQNYGDTVQGKIISIDANIAQTNMDGTPKTFDNGDPMLMHRVNLQTDLRKGEGLKDFDPSEPDDGRRSIYLRGSKKPESQSTMAAVIGAARAATGKASIDPGGHLGLKYTGEEGPVGKRRKLYQATYTAPSVSLDEQQATQPAQQSTQQQAPAGAALNPWGSPSNQGEAPF